MLLDVPIPADRLRLIFVTDSSNINELQKVSNTPDFTAISFNQAHSTASDVHQNIGVLQPPFQYTNRPEPPVSPSSETSCPVSPPPTYAAAVQSTTQTQYFPTDDKRYYHANLPNQTYGQLSKTEVDTKRPVEAHFEPKSTWAFQLAPKHLTVSELPGDTVSLSATNAFGPVNPYEFCAAPQSSNPGALSKKDETKAVVEMLGDLSFAVELPCNDPGPPPGYPPRSNQRFSHNPDSYTPESKGYVFEQRKSVPELPAMPRRRPAPLHHAFTEPLYTAHELPASSSASSINASFPRRSSVMGAAQLGVAASGSQQVFGQPSEVQGSRSAGSHQMASSQLPASMAPTASPSTQFSSFQSVMPGPPQSVAQSSGLNGPPMPFKPQEPTGSTSRARMQRQRQMMDMLGSIGS